jgi:ABC-type multidrug transport system fused ATPase/permease subunit
VAELSWQTSAGRGVAVHAPEGSYPARRADGELREAERVVEALAELLSPPPDRRRDRVDVYLTDAIAADEGQADVLGDAIVCVIQPDAPAEPIAYPLTRTLVRRWFGPKAATASPFVEGIAGVVGGRRDEADARIRAQLDAGETVSVFAPGSPDVATSFAAFLLETFGPGSLRELLAAYDPDRRDQAVVTAYQRPLAALEELWLARLRHVSGARATFRALVGHLVPLLKPEWRRWLEIAAYMLVGVGYTITIPLGFKYLFDTVIPDRSYERLGILVAVLFVIFVANAFVTVRRSYVTALVNQRVLFGLQARMFERLQRLSHDFYGRAKVGDLMSRLSQDLNTVQEATSAVLVQGLFLLLSALAAAITALVLSPLLGALVLVVVPLFALSYVVLLSRIRAASREVQTVYGQVAATMQENLSAHSVVKALGLEDRAVASYRGRLDGLLRTVMRLVLFSSTFEASVGMAVTLGQLLVIGVGGYLVIGGNLTIGTLVAFVGLMPTFFQPVTALANVGEQVQRAAGAIDRMLEILEQPIGVPEREDAVELPRVAREIRLERVSFGYGPDRTILDDLDLTIPAGSHVAIVGASGSGKSTVVNLLLRFWDPQGGRVVFDGHDLRDVTLESLRGQIGLVFQDTFVFDTTVRENVALAREGATDAEVEAAVRAAQLADWVESLPTGLDTLLGERGVRMSGGQRQRLAIARALLRDPELLILDEATSALDARTEAEILETLEQLAQGRTTISITHRLSLSARADHIFVLDEGRVVEEGTHAELVRAGGPYQRLYEEQMAHVHAGVAPIGIEAARLATIPLFGELGPGELSQIAQRLTAEQYEAGAEIVRQGDEGRTLGLVGSGQVEVVLAHDGSERRINLLNEGDFFGEMALLTGEPRIATVRATMPTEVYSLAREDFLALLEGNPDLRRAVDQTVAARRQALFDARAARTSGVAVGASERLPHA